MSDRPADIVRRGYDEIAERYREERLAKTGGPISRFLQVALSTVRERCVALDLGCGAGEPVTAALAAGSRFVVGVDLSATQLALAHRRLPEAAFAQADMTEVAFRSGSFDAVLSFFSIIHVPRQRHAAVFVEIYDWLRPGGVFAGTLGFGDNPEERQPDWLGAPMYWSHFDAETNLGLVERAGFVLERSEVLENDEETFLGVIARKPAALGGVRPRG
jgi:SAM-dependent methyltransferase